MRNENRSRKRGRAAAAPSQPPRGSDEELLFVCPDRDETGFTPSSR